MKKIILCALLLLSCAISALSDKSVSDAKYLKTNIFGSSDRMYPITGALMLEVLSATQNDDKGEFWVLDKDTLRNVSDVIDTLVRENLVREVCNVPFGSSYGEAKDILNDQLGNCYTSSKDCIAYTNKTYEGIQYDDVNFLFQSNGERSFLCRAVFGKDCKSLQEAIDLKKRLDEQLSKRYRLYKILDEDGLYLSVGGISPVTGDGNFAITVDIIEYSKQIQDSGIKCAVRITYGPFEYIE